MLYIVFIYVDKKKKKYIAYTLRGMCRSVVVCARACVCSVVHIMYIIIRLLLLPYRVVIIKTDRHRFSGRIGYTDAHIFNPAVYTYIILYIKRKCGY